MECKSTNSKSLKLDCGTKTNHPRKLDNHAQTSILFQKSTLIQMPLNMRRITRLSHTPPSWIPLQISRRPRQARAISLLKAQILKVPLNLKGFATHLPQDTWEQIVAISAWIQWHSSLPHHRSGACYPGEKLRRWSSNARPQWLQCASCFSDFLMACAPTRLVLGVQALERIQLPGLEMRGMASQKMHPKCLRPPPSPMSAGPKRALKFGVAGVQLHGPIFVANARIQADQLAWPAQRATHPSKAQPSSAQPKPQTGPLLLILCIALPLPRIPVGP